MKIDTPFRRPCRHLFGKRLFHSGETYSALLFYRYARRCGLSMKAAYQVALARHGWPVQAKEARYGLEPLQLAILAKA